MDTSTPQWVLIGKPYERPKNLLATPETIDHLIELWSGVTICIRTIVCGRQQEDENAYVDSGDKLVPFTIPCLSHNLKCLTSLITQYGGDLYPWFDSRPFWDFWIGVERWHSDRSRDSSLRLEAEYQRAFIEQFRLKNATARDHPKNIERALAFRSKLVAAGHPARLSLPAPSGNGPTATNGRDPKAPAHRNGIDYDALADSLLRSKHALASKLVKFMKDRSTATFQEVIDEVHGGERTSEATRSLINRTNNHLHELNSRLSFSTKAEHIIRHIAPE